MKNLITKKQEHMLYKDELGDDFLLLKIGEIYESPKGRNNLRLVTWSKTIHNSMAKLGLTLNDDSTDDPLWLIDFKRENLPKLCELWANKKRFKRNSAWLLDKEKRLAHQIIPCYLK